MIRLRPHHLLCFCFYEHKGYNQEFIDNMDKITSSIDKVLLTYENDDVCQCCPNIQNNICKSINKVNKYDKLVIELLNAKTNEIYDYDYLHQLVIDKIIKQDKLKDICADCEWYDICKKGVNR